MRSRLRAADVRLVLLVLARGDATRRAAYERLLCERGPDALLDDPALFGGLRAVRSVIVPSPALFAYVAVRHALLAAGVDDRPLADYLAALLLEFGSHGRHTRVRQSDDASYDYAIDILADLAGQDAGGERGFLLQAHLGNYALWLAGLFPDHIAARRHRSGGPDLPYYDELGRHGYALASRHQLAERLGVAGIFSAAAARFGTLRVAFNRLSDRVFFPHVVTPDRILRSV